MHTIETQELAISNQMLETNDVTELADLQKRLDDIGNEQTQLMDEWEILSQELENIIG